MSLILNATTEKSRQLKLKSDYVEENHSNKIIVNFATIKEATIFKDKKLCRKRKQINAKSAKQQKQKLSRDNGYIEVRKGKTKYLNCPKQRVCCCCSC